MGRHSEREKGKGKREKGKRGRGSRGNREGEPMDRRTVLFGALGLPLGVGRRVAASGQVGAGWTPLFNGRDLGGWETFLGKPHRLTEVPGLAKDSSGDYAAVVGVDTDPRAVFSVVQVDGAPAIRISGEIYGALTSRREYGNY